MCGGCLMEVWKSCCGRFCLFLQLYVANVLPVAYIFISGIQESRMHEIHCQFQRLSSINCNFQGPLRPWILTLKLKDFQVIFQKRVRVFHRGFQTRENWWKHSAYGLVLLLFSSVWNPRWNTKRQVFEIASQSCIINQEQWKNSHWFWHRTRNINYFFCYCFSVIIGLCCQIF